MGIGVLLKAGFAVGVTLILIASVGESAPANSWSGSTRSQSPSAKRQKTGHKVMEPAFENAGQTAGIEVWRIEDFKPVAYPKNQYGKFYSGDSYIVLSTKINKKGEKSWDIHFWLGSQTSQDEAGAAAILSVQLDEQLGGGPVEHRELENHESQLFLSYFKSGVRYLQGGVSSGFHHVDRNAFETRLFQVKGARNIRVKQVVPNISSMNKGDCFILDTGNNIYIYVGTKAKRVEKLKATAAANQIRDQDHSGKSKVVIVDEFSPQSDFDDYFNALGGGSREEVPEESAGGDDQQFETNEERIVTLYRVSDASGKLQVTPVGQRPLEASLLDENDCFILDTGDSNIFVWIGKKGTNQEKQQAMGKADAFLVEHKHPKWTNVQRIVQGAEPVAFTQYFRTWQGTGELRHRLVRSASSDWEPRLYHMYKKTPGSKFIIEEVHNFNQEDLNVDDVLFMDVGRQIFIWIGNNADEEEKGESGEVVQSYLQKHGREDVAIVTIHQGEENEEFQSYFAEWNPNFWDDHSPNVRHLIKNFEED
ncbi:gelsolin-like [Cylas formicarius]|uniref:gelsolin-like n=1 Tax=Cylas formicarius TaxID=197179 RepID=UPI0029586D0C|nr:gelsolin-like [Cylas formicarius]